MKQTLLTSLALGVALALPAYAVDETATDVGTLDKETATKMFPAKPASIRLRSNSRAA